MKLSERYDPKSLEPTWQERWEEAGLFRADARPRRPEEVRAGDAAVPQRLHAHGARPQLPHRRRVRPLLPDARASTCCTPWAGTPSGCRPRTPRSRTASTRPSAPARTSIASGRRCARSASPTTGPGRSTPATPSTTGGTSGSSSGCCERDMVYRRFSKVNWCTGCLTVIANEQVKDGPLRALRLAGGGARDAGVGLPHHPQQRGPAPGARRAHRLAGAHHLGAAELDRQERGRRGRLRGRPTGGPIRVFTTRIDTVYGGTYLVLAPDHPLVPSLTAPSRRAEVEAFAARMAATGEDRAHRRGRAEGGRLHRGHRRPTPSPGSRCPSGSPTSSSATTAPAR